MSVLTGAVLQCVTVLQDVTGVHDHVKQTKRQPSNGLHASCTSAPVPSLLSRGPPS